MFFFVIGLVFQSLVFSSSFVGFIWFAEATPKLLYRAMQLLPFFNFGLFYLTISLFTTGKYDPLTQTSVAGPGFYFSSLYTNIPGNLLPQYLTDTPTVVPLPVSSLLVLLFDTALYGVLTWYFDKVIPDEYGMRANPIFFLSPYYWGYTPKINNSLDDFISRVKPLEERSIFKVADEDLNVRRERSIVFDKTLQREARIGNLRKVYRKSFLFKSSNDKVAVQSLCLTMQEGSLLALLGQNGAGKSTTMACLSGLSPPTAGDALFYGSSVTKSLLKIREVMGICPQHDILFNDLTAMEHIALFGGLKNLSQNEILRVSEERLKAVRLYKVKDQRAGKYSGGMKRRLSVLISTLGDPRIIFLDEPTTGMDPVNRRHVWSFLENFKQNRIVVLTTHSMEEADVLGDQVAIMAKGRLCALGTGVELKTKYGDGYRISIIAKDGLSEKAKFLVANNVAQAVLEDDSAGSLIYRVPPSFMSSVPEFIKLIDSPNGKAVVESWGLSQTTLEEVFLKLIRAAAQ